jgi:hypothetical protein
MPNWVVIWKKGGRAFQWTGTGMAGIQLQYSEHKEKRQTEIAEMLEWIRDHGP